MIEYSFFSYDNYRGDNYIYKCYRYLGIKAETKHQVHYRKRKEKDKYPNLIFTTWETIDKPRQVIVSDMTAFKFWILYFEVTFYFDVFTKKQNCVLLPRSNRRKSNIWRVPRKNSGISYGFGQANVWFATGREQNTHLDTFLNKLVKQIEEYDGENWRDVYATRLD